jgi:hypothetical protein
MNRCLPMIPLLLMLVGCSGQPAPRLSVIDASMTERSDSGMVVTFTVQADNATGHEVPLRDVEYEVLFHGRPVFRGTRSAQATVRRYGTQDFTLPIAIPAGGNESLTGAVPYTLKGKVTYLVPGALAEALFDMDVVRPSTDFEGRGVVDLSSPATP